MVFYSSFYLFLSLFIIYTSSSAVFTTCGDLSPMYNRTACNLETSSCCQQKWNPEDGHWGCIDYVNAVCCPNGYTACPENTTCQLKEKGEEPYNDVYECIKDNQDKFYAKSVCKTGAPLLLSKTKANVLILGDSISIGYTPYVAESLNDLALVQHTPYEVNDGGAEDAYYGNQCLDHLLSSPNGTILYPDILMFNFGMHNTGNKTVPGQLAPPDLYIHYLDKIVNKLLKWSESSPNKKY